MSRRARRMLTLTLLVGALPVLTIACPFLVLKLDVKNDAAETLAEFNLVPDTSDFWGDNALEGPLAPGGKVTIRDIGPGDYAYRAIFSSISQGETTLEGALTFGTLNICLSFGQYSAGDTITPEVTEVL